MRILSILLIIFSLQSVNAELKYKTPRVKKEFEQLFEKNLELYQIVEYADSLVKKDVVITEIYRTQAEQDRYYKGKPKFTSPHQKWLAVDLRTRNLTKKQITKIVKEINDRYNQKNTYIPTAFYHTIGKGYHIHMQFKRRK